MKKEELQQLVMQALGGASWEFDLENNTATYSDEFFALIGYAPKELQITSDWVADNIHPEELSQWREAFVKCVKGESRYFDCELRFRHKQDYYVWIQTRGIVTDRAADGRARRVVGMVFDISERMGFKESESRYRLFLDNIPDALSLKDQEGRYLYINRQFEKWLGKASYRIHGKTAGEIFHPEADTLEILREHERQVWDTGETISMERRFPLTEDGHFRFALITKFPVYDESGHMLAIGTTNTDVTERYLTQQALQESEQRYRRLFESAPVVLAESDWSAGKKLIDGLLAQGVKDVKEYLIEHPELIARQDQVMKVLNVNQEAVRVFGAGSAEELIAYAEGEVNEEQRLLLIEELASFAAGHRRSIIRGYHSRVDGSPFPIIRTTELYSEDPEDWSQILLTLRETSAEEAVRMSEIRYRRLFESAPVALYESDWSRGKQLIDNLREQGVDDIGQYLLDHPELLPCRGDVLRILNCNSEALKVYQANNREELVAWIEGEMNEEQRASLIEVLEIFASGRRRSSVRSWSRRLNGETFPILRDSELVSSHRGDWSRVLSSIHDLTAEVEAADRLREYQQELRSLAGKISLAEESERRRISSELHDGTVQNLVLSRIHLANLKKSLDSDSDVELADSINQLLERSLQETRSLVFEISPPVLYELGLEPAVEWLAEHYRQSAGIEVQINTDDRTTSLSEEMNIVLFQTARELLVNIVKHARAGKVAIDWHHNDNSVVMTVRDDGVGFDINNSGVRRATEGGFGLFSIRERLNLLGADLDIQSSAQGTRITITAPAHTQ